MKTPTEIMQEISADYLPSIINAKTYEDMKLAFEMAICDALRMELMEVQQNISTKVTHQPADDYSITLWRNNHANS